MKIGSQSGAYRIDALLGRGGMAEVYRAWNTGLQRYEALKVLPPHMTFDKSFVDRFLNEARMAAGLHHPHIATIHAVSDPGAPQPYFAMELIEGEDLANLLRRRGSLPWPEALPIVFQIAEALDYAHHRGVMHRDVKPANVLLQPTGNGGWSVKVVDFGIARALEAGDGARLTKTGMIVGTPEYMSPEQGGSGERVNYRSDQYSLGVVAYEMLCGRPPFRARDDGSAISVIIAHQRELPTPLMDRVPDLPRSVNEAILKALAKRPDERWASCQAFVEGCSSIADSVSARTPSKRPAALLPAVLIGLFLLGAALIVFSLSRSSNNSLPPTASVASAPSSDGGNAVHAPLPAGGTTGLQAVQAGEDKPLPTPIPEAASTSIPETTDWKSWQGNGFTLQYPFNWTVSQKTTADGPRVQFSAPEPNMTVIVDSSVANWMPSPLANWQDMDQRLQKRYGPDYQLVSLAPSTLDGDPAAVWVFTLMPKGQAELLKRTDIAVTHGRIGYALMLSAPAASSDTWHDQFAHIQASFHLSGP